MQAKLSSETPGKSPFEQLRIPLVAGWRDLDETGGEITVQRLVAGGGITLQPAAAQRTEQKRV